jgi:hypothetical protein
VIGQSRLAAACGRMGHAPVADTTKALVTSEKSSRPPRKQLSAQERTLCTKIPRGGHGLPPENIECADCGRETANSCNLNQHSASEGNCDSPKCLHCSIASRIVEMLSRGSRRCHSCCRSVKGSPDPPASQPDGLWASETGNRRDHDRRI